MENYTRLPQLTQILDSFQKDESYFRSCVQILRKWMEKQPHLPSDRLSDEFLEISLIQNKLSIEKTKSKIEFYCTAKSMNRYKYLFKKELFVPSKEPMIYVPIPVLTEDNYRILLGRMENSEQYEMAREFNNFLKFREIMSRCDYNNGEIFIIDFMKLTPMVLTRFRPNVMMDGINLNLKAYSARIKQVHLISPLGSRVFSLLKPLMPSKIASRFQIHDSIEAMKDIFPAKYLPSDFGGKLKSIAELLADFDRFVESQNEKILEYLDTKSVEELRIEPITDDMQGTFMKLNID